MIRGFLVLIFVFLGFSNAFSYESCDYKTNCMQYYVPYPAQGYCAGGNPGTYLRSSNIPCTPNTQCRPKWPWCKGMCHKVDPRYPNTCS